MGRPDHVEMALVRAFGHAVGQRTPPRLAAAMRHAVFPGGARVRPRLLMAVAHACGVDDDGRAAAEDAAAAVELMHCASLVHDDLPCFDNAPIRRGRATVHAKYGESTAVLVGDGLIVAAMETLADACARHPRLLPALGVLARATGGNGGLVAGQAWEGEPQADIARYHHAKTGALFEAATCMGAIAAGVDHGPWRALGARFGEAYQIADDLLDLVGTPTELGKPVGQDVVHARPSAAIELGLERAWTKLDEVLQAMRDDVPGCAAAPRLHAWLDEACARLFPARRLSHRATLVRDAAVADA
ncbi:MAG: polyprenyl synthetase family protein [Deltaproteobacteria bacterium]|nr:polyprenyl synthetase family protein [Deltaproteobacteria bacterium]